MIIEETCRILTLNHYNLIKDLTIADVRIGLNMSAVKLSDGSYGMAGTLSGGLEHDVQKSQRDYGEFTPNQIKGKKVMQLLETEKQSNIVGTLKIATLNAISSNLLPSSGYKVFEDKDPVDLLDLTKTNSIVMVGAFQSYIRKIAATENRLQVLEMNPDSLPHEFSHFYVPANDYKKIIPDAEIVIITGITLVNNTLDGLLNSITAGTQVIVTGPSANILPEVLFNHNVDIIGATRITHPEMLFSTVSEGGAGYHLFRYCAQKICVINDSQTFI